jgi:hypothetical protein
MADAEPRNDTHGAENQIAALLEERRGFEMWNDEGGMAAVDAELEARGYQTDRVKAAKARARQQSAAEPPKGRRVRPSSET